MGTSPTRNSGETNSLRLRKMREPPPKLRFIPDWTSSRVAGAAGSKKCPGLGMVDITGVAGATDQVMLESWTRVQVHGNVWCEHNATRRPAIALAKATRHENLRFHADAGTQIKASG